MKPQKLKVNIISLGCPKNLIDTRNIMRALPKKSVEFTNSADEADLYLLNTCAFIHDAKEESFDTIMELVNYKKADLSKKIIVTGCLAQRYYSKIKSAFPEIDGLYKIKDEPKIANKITRLAEKKSKVKEYMRYYNNLTLTQPHYTYVKISDGCDEKCSYCVIPQIRGKFRSIPAGDIISDIKTALKTGVYEIILVAQDLLYYGRDIGTDIYDLLTQITALRSDFVIRLLYLNVNLITPEFVDFVLANPKIVNYFDLPLQHVNKRILTMMRRNPGSAERFLSIKEHLAASGAEYNTRSSFIVGFPTESARDFKEILEFLQKADIDNAGFFKYSHEEGSEAYKLYEDNITARTKNIRLRRAYEQQNRIAFARNKQLLDNGAILDCCVDYEISKNLYRGRTLLEAPEIDRAVMIETKKRLISGDGARVKVTGVDGPDIIGGAL